MPNSATCCAKCGVPLPSPEAVRVVYDANVTALRSLFSGELDQLACGICNVASTVVPTVFFVCTNSAKSWLVTGSECSESEVTSQLSKISAFSGKTIERLASCNILRQRIVERVHVHLQVIREPLFMDDCSQFLKDNWRAFYPSLFASFVIAVVPGNPEIDLGIFAREGEAPPTVANLFVRGARLQAQVWKSIALSWMLDEGPKGDRFEEDLAVYIDPSFLLKGAPANFSDYVDRALERGIPLTGHFVLGAIRASVFEIGKQSDPSANQWAEDYFAMELELSRSREKNQSVLKALQIDDERARKTVTYRSAYDAVGRRLEQTLNDHERSTEERIAYMNLVNGIAKKCGYADLVEEVVAKSVVLQPSTHKSLSELLTVVEKIASRFPPEEFRPGMANSVAAILVRERRVDDLEELANVLQAKMGGGFMARAATDAWLGERLKELREPSRFLARAGATARSWEHDLPTDVRLGLWVERSNALRLLGRSHEALKIAEACRPLTEGATPKKQQGVRRNIAILQRETGAPDVALLELQMLLQEADSNEEQLDLLTSIAVCFTDLNQIEEALNATERALGLAKGPAASVAGRLEAYRISMLVDLGRFDEAVAALMRVSETPDDPLLELGRAAGCLAFLKIRPELLKANQKELHVRALRQVIDKARAARDIQTYLTGLWLLASLAQVSSDADAPTLWLDVFRAHQEEKVPQRPDTLLWLAVYAYMQGRPHLGHDFLTQVPSALQIQFSSVEDLFLAADSAKNLADPLETATDIILFNGTAGASFRDIRLISELGRDAVGRVRQGRFRQKDHPVLNDGLTDDVLAKLAPKHGKLGVIEWVSGRNRAGRFITTIDTNGNVESSWLPLPEVDEASLLRRIRSRLMAWRTGKQGDPFDLADWSVLCAWLEGELCQYLEREDHVVFIESTPSTGLPWHIAARRHWTTSYCASWSNLLSLAERPRVPPQTLGAFVVPIFNDSDAVLGAFGRSTEHVQLIGRQLGSQVIVKEGASADREAFVSMMQNADLVKLLCHGFLNKEHIELIVADGRSLPPGDRLAITGVEGKPFRLAWQELQRLNTSPAVVFSAACSSGNVSVRGLGERLGLFNALLPSGTRSLVAPLWDVEAETVLMISDDAFERYALGKTSLANAVYDACEAAESNYSPWLSWALAIEGDWR